MKKSKAILMVVCAMLLVAASVMGTLAYLTSQDSVTNTFSVGKVKITLDEAKVGEDGKKLTGAEAARGQGNEYHLLPGHEYDKDPTVTVKGGSEDCYLFVKFEENGNPADYYTYTSLLKAPDWTKLEGETNVWYREVRKIETDISYDLLDDDKITVKESVTNANMADAAAAELIWTAYAIQLANTGTAAEAWAKIST